MTLNKVVAVGRLLFLALYVCLCISLIPKLLCGGGGKRYTHKPGNEASLCICIRSATKKSKQQEGPLSTPPVHAIFPTTHSGSFRRSSEVSENYSGLFPEAACSTCLATNLHYTKTTEPYSRQRVHHVRLLTLVFIFENC